MANLVAHGGLRLDQHGRIGDHIVGRPAQSPHRGTPQQVRGEGHSLSRPAGHKLEMSFLARLSKRSVRGVQAPLHTSAN